MAFKTLLRLVLFYALVCQVMPSTIYANTLSSSQGAAFTYTGDSYGAFGTSVASIGDINGDSIADFAVGIKNDNYYTGKVAIIYGVKGGLSSLNANSLTQSQGFVITGANSGDYFGASVAGLGDINGDGYNDFAIGATGYSSSKGAVYVIYGKGTTRASFSVSSLATSTGFMIYGSTAAFNTGEIGSSIARVGDFDKDGYNDILIAAYKYNSNDGRAWIIYGVTGTSRTAIDLASLTNANGFYISYTAGYTIKLGTSISSAGDLNSDGYMDIIVGAPSACQAYVIWGRSGKTTASISTASLTSTYGFTIKDSTYTVAIGSLVLGGGDINSDGKLDILVGGVDSYSKSNEYVLFNAYKGVDIEVSTLTTTNGFKITASSSLTSLGYSGSMKGDVTGDGIDDIILGAPLQGSTFNGAVFVVKGRKTGFSNIIAENSASNIVYGSTYLGYLGSAISIGDFNGDGKNDVLVGESGASSGQGKAYVVYGGSCTILDGYCAATKTKLKGGAIAGIVVGAVVVIIVIITVSIIQRRMKRSRKQVTQISNSSAPAPTTVVINNYNNNASYNTTTQPQYNQLQQSPNTSNMYSPNQVPNSGISMGQPANQYYQPQPGYVQQPQGYNMQPQGYVQQPVYQQGYR